MSYGNQEYGGGGSGGNNYYDQSQDFSGRNESHGNQSYGGSSGGYGGNQESNYGGNNNYGGNQGGYNNQGSSSGYGEQTQSHHNRRNSDDFSSAAQHAQEHHDSGASGSLFNSALDFIKERKSQYNDSEVDEEHAVNAHQAMYGSGSGSSSEQHDSRTLGAGAAMQALKMFTGGSSSGSDGGMDKNKLIGLAMAQAGKLWEEKNSSGNVVCFLSLSLFLVIVAWLLIIVVV
jgi:hypothetical protein